MKYYIIIVCQLFFIVGNAQFTDKVWCFGDSAGLNFNNIINAPLPFAANHLSKGSCVSICDSSGRLLFYSFTQAGMIGNTTLVIDSTFNPMQNGNNIVGQGWYNELVIVPKPGSANIFYLFSNGITNSGLEGLYYSVIDMNQNNGLGTVILKNVLISSSDYADSMIAVKHGNGRDWWLILHTWFNSNSFHTILITPQGIGAINIQNLGLFYNIDSGDFAYNYQTSKLLTVNQEYRIQVLDFDRCSGILTNPVTIQNGGFNSLESFGCSISPNGTIAYVSNVNNIFGDSLRLHQYDLTAPNIGQSRQTIYQQQVPASGGQHAIGPDGKIYISCLYEYGYPYADSIHNIYSDNLSVINYPDSIGLACDFQPFSVNLGGARTYWGLPNNPNYEAGAWVGSPCDTLTGINEAFHDQPPEMNVYYHSGYGILFVNANNLSGKNYLLTVYEMSGKIIVDESGALNSVSYTKDFSLKNKSPGLYVVAVRTEKEFLVKKILIQ